MSIDPSGDYYSPPQHIKVFIRGKCLGHRLLGLLLIKWFFKSKYKSFLCLSFLICKMRTRILATS